MKSVRRGRPISGAEVTNVSTNGIWLLLDHKEHFLGYADFPWFENATIRQISRVERPSPHHLYWPELDIDLAVDSLDHPEAYPLVSAAPPSKRLRQTSRNDPLSAPPKARARRKVRG
jgi:hypothetical protein